MNLLEEVKKAKEQGISEDKIVQFLRNEGFQYREIADALSQSRIQEAVASPDEAPTQEQTQELVPPTAPEMLAPEPSAPAPIAEEQTYYQEQVPYPGGYSQQQYTQYGQQPSSDTSLVNEIAEQVVAEKMSGTQRQIEKLTDIKSIIQSKVESLDDRLKRIEKIIDTLQSSVLKKVGDYVNNVEDIKQELIETQKTFASIASKAGTHKNTSQHHEHHIRESHPHSKHNKK